MKLRWTRPALTDIAEIHAFIAQDNPVAALKVARMLRAQAESLTAYPMIGRPGRIAGTRELVVASLPYIIAYRLAETSVDILAIRHGARQPPAG